MYAILQIPTSNGSSLRDVPQVASGPSSMDFPCCARSIMSITLRGPSWWEVPHNKTSLVIWRSLTVTGPSQSMVPQSERLLTEGSPSRWQVPYEERSLIVRGSSRWKLLRGERTLEVPRGEKSQKVRGPLTVWALQWGLLTVKDPSRWKTPSGKRSPNGERYLMARSSSEGPPWWNDHHDGRSHIVRHLMRSTFANCLSPWGCCSCRRPLTQRRTSVKETL